jgi:hypothetical protein
LKYKNGTHNFKIRYNGDYKKIPFCEWNEECDVNVLYSWYNNWKDEDYDKTCGIKDTKAETWLTIAILFFGVIFIFFLVWMINHLKKKSGLKSEQ